MSKTNLNAIYIQSSNSSDPRIYFTSRDDAIETLNTLKTLGYYDPDNFASSAGGFNAKYYGTIWECSIGMNGAEAIPYYEITVPKQAFGRKPLSQIYNFISTRPAGFSFINLASAFAEHQHTPA